MWNYPNYVAECLANESMVMENVNPFDVCGNDRSDNDLYRCLEEGVYGNSIIVLDKNTFETKLALPTQGVGTWSNKCYETGLFLNHYAPGEEQDAYWWDNDYCQLPCPENGVHLEHG